MPAPLAGVDWTAVRATYAATGSFVVTARAHDIDDAAVRQRAKREGWREDRDRALEHSLIIPDNGEVSQRVTKPAPHVAMRNALAEMGEKIRITGAKVAQKGLETAHDWEGEKIIAAASGIKALMDVGEKAVGWNQAGATPTLRLELVARSVGQLQAEDLPSIDVEAEVTREEKG
jgi:hypothetical protein